MSSGWHPGALQGGQVRHLQSLRDRGDPKVGPEDQKGGRSWIVPLSIGSDDNHGHRMCGKCSTALCTSSVIFVV